MAAIIQRENKRPLSLDEKVECYLNCRLTPEEIDKLWVELILYDYLSYLKCMANLKMLKFGNETS
jgi:hypothetical protein